VLDLPINPFDVELVEEEENLSCFVVRVPVIEVRADKKLIIGF